jgi:alanine racemase
MGREGNSVTDLSTWVEVDLDAFAHNLRLIQGLVGPSVRLHLVVKADAYGHGVAPIARTAAEEGVHSLGVATQDEGIELRHEGVRLPIVILSPSLPFEAAKIVEYRLTPTVGNLEIARAVSQESVERGLVTEVQVEIDTGMGRTGVAPGDAVPFLSALSSLPGLKLAGMYTHFPKADQPAGAPMLERQLADFRLVVESVRTAGLDPGLLHAANSAAIVNCADSYLDMVRPGALAYGITPSASVRAPENLKPVMRFASRLVHVRELGPGHPISYGGDFVTPERMRVGTAPVGYGHGFPFALSGRGYALLRGRRVPILGRVTMDTTVFDLRGVPEARLGDEIVLFGRQGDEMIRVAELAALAGTISYELLCGIGRRVTRVYTKVGRRVGSRTLLGAEPTVPVRPEE